LEGEGSKGGKESDNDSSQRVNGGKGE